MNWRVFTQSYTAIPLMLLAILAMMILPLPGWLLDALFTFNIVLAVLVLLVSVSARRPLDFFGIPNRVAGCHPDAAVAERGLYPCGVAARS